MDSPDSTTTATHNLIPTRSAAADIVHNDIVLSEADADAIQASADFALAPATRRVYRSLWQGFDSWCRSRGYEALPAAAVAVAAFLAARAQTSSAATLSLSAAAIGYYHRQHSLPNPTDSQGVKLVLAGLARQHRAGSQRQAKGLSREDLAAIRATACQPRIGRGGRPESARLRPQPRPQRYCPLLDHVGRDAAPRRSGRPDLGRRAPRGRQLRPTHRSTQQDRPERRRQGPLDLAVLDVRARARRIAAARKQPTDPLFNLSPPQITRRIAQACKAAGLGNWLFRTQPARRRGPGPGGRQHLSSARDHATWTLAVANDAVAKYTRDAAAAAQSAMAKLYAQGG